jgi:peptidoglycan/LPS O-acetylase OafA/YrhL
MSSDLKRIPSLDCIRAISITLVLVCHYGRDLGWREPPVDLGLLGVRIFFVISGYLITGLLMNEVEKYGNISISRFYFRRTFRIFPAFYFYVACMLSLAAFGWTNLSLRQAVIALTYTSNYFPTHLPFTMQHTWSLATEEQFYLIWPAVLSVSGLKRGIVALLTLLIAAPISSHILATLGHPVPAFFNAPIGIGCLLALIRTDLHRSYAYRLWERSRFGVLLPLLFVFCSFSSYHASSIRDAAFALVTNITIALWIDWAVTRTEGPAFRCLNSKWVAYIGVLSYSLYLWQQPFLALGHKPPALLLSGPWLSLSWVVPRFSMIALCTLLSYYMVERPMLRLRTWLEPRVFRKRSSAPLTSPSLSGPLIVQDNGPSTQGIGI